MIKIPGSNRDFLAIGHARHGTHRGGHIERPRECFDPPPIKTRVQMGAKGKAMRTYVDIFDAFAKITPFQRLKRSRSRLKKGYEVFIKHKIN